MRIKVRFEANGAATAFLEGEDLDELLGEIAILMVHGPPGGIPPSRKITIFEGIDDHYSKDGVKWVEVTFDELDKRWRSER